jgi:hypothetical protein
MLEVLIYLPPNHLDPSGLGIEVLGARLIDFANEGGGFRGNLLLVI